MTIILRLNDLKQNYFAFFGRFILERRGTKKGLVRGNDRNAAGTTHSVWGRRAERWRRKAERWATSCTSGPRSCHSDLVPRSRVVPNRSRRKGCFGTTPERSRNEEGGWAKVGVFPPKKSLIPAAFHCRSDSSKNVQGNVNTQKAQVTSK